MVIAFHELTLGHQYDDLITAVHPTMPEAETDDRLNKYLEVVKFFADPSNHWREETQRIGKVRVSPFFLAGRDGDRLGLYIEKGDRSDIANACVALRWLDKRPSVLISKRYTPRWKQTKPKTWIEVEPKYLGIEVC